MAGTMILVMSTVVSTMMILGGSSSVLGIEGEGVDQRLAVSAHLSPQLSGAQNSVAANQGAQNENLSIHIDGL